MDAIGAKTKISSGGHAVVRIDPRAARDGKAVGFCWRSVAGSGQHRRLLADECQGQAVAKPLRSRRISVLADAVRWCFFRPVMLRYRRNGYFAYRRSSQSRLIGKRALPVRAQRPQSTWLVAKDRPLAWRTGQGALIGNKVIIAERHGVFCQLLFDYYAVAQPAGEPCRTSHWPDVFCDYGENCQPQEDRWQAGDNPHRFYDARFFSTAPEPCFVLFRKSRFGFWHIKLLAALLLLFVLVAGLDALTGIQGYFSLHTLSAAGLLSGLIVALAVIALLVLVMCMLRR